MKSKSVMQFLFSMTLLPICFGVFAQGELQRLNISDFGAVADTNVVSTEAIQAAIDSAYLSGGGIVVFPAGNYCAGTIVLKKNVTLLLEEGATLYASTDINDYRMPLDDATKPVLIYANGAENISLTGKGRIHGRAKRVYRDLKKVDLFIEDITENARKAGVEMKRFYVVKPDVSLINIAKCKNINIEGITVEESTFWSMHLVRCINVRINAVRVISSLESGVNSDGIDINSSQDVVITNSFISTGDDAIVLKTRYIDPCQNIRVSNCTLSSSSTALKIGTESHGDFRDIKFENCTIENTNRGLSIVVMDGATVENIHFSNIEANCTRRHFNWWGNGDPIWLYVSKRNVDSRIGEIRAVSFTNIKASGMGTSRIESTESNTIKDIKFNNVELKMNAENYPDKRAGCAFVAIDVTGLEMNNVSVSWDDIITEPNWSNGFFFSGVKQLKIRNIEGRQGLLNSENPMILLNNINSGYIQNVLPKEGTNVTIGISGGNTKDLIIMNVDPMMKSKKAMQIGDEVDESEIEFRTE
jgi:hypothetical protein